MQAVAHTGRPHLERRRQRSIGSSPGCLGASSANEDRESYSPACRELELEVGSLHSLPFRGVKVCRNGSVLVVSGNLTQLSDGLFSGLNVLVLLVRQADRTLGLLAPMLP